MIFLFFLYWVGFPLFCVAYASFAEWWLHSKVMHKPLGNFTYPYKAHALKHHVYFKADNTYVALDSSDPRVDLIPMKWWNGPAIIFIGAIPFWFLVWLTSDWWFIICPLIILSFYYLTYEFIHWCMHLPRKRVIERSGLFFRLNGHHLLHHRYMGKNFNVVCPLADLVLGTLMLRAKVRFAQAEGTSIPNVQPDFRGGFIERLVSKLFIRT